MGGLVLLLVWVLCFDYCGNLGLYCCGLPLLWCCGSCLGFVMRLLG